VDGREGIDFDDEDATSVDLEVLWRVSPKEEARALIEELMLLASSKEEQLRFEEEDDKGRNVHLELPVVPNSPDSPLFRVLKDERLPWELLSSIVSCILSMTTCHRSLGCGIRNDDHPRSASSVGGSSSCF